MGFLDFLNNIQETSEMHSKKEFRTRYFRCGYTKAKEAVELFAKNNGYHVGNIDDAHGEIFLQTNKYHVMVSVIQINPLETAVDIKVQTYGPIGFNKPGKIILQMYAALNNTLTFKGVSLHP